MLFKLGLSFSYLLFIIFLKTSKSAKSDFYPPEMYCEGPDCYATTTEMIINKGYHVEEHKAITSDGYVLTLNRIPYGTTEKGAQGISNKNVVLICHGIFSSSATFVVNPTNVSLAYILADEGYDVWLGNYRGTPESQKHQKYTVDDPEFWEFPFDALVQEDNPTFIDYILAHTGQKQLFYIGHSQATAALIGMLAYKPEYNAKIREAYLMCPIILLTGGFGGTVPFFLKSFVNRDAQKSFLKDFSPNPAVFPTPKSYYEIRGDFCEKNFMVGFVCSFVKPDYENQPGIIQERIPVYRTVFPTGTSAYVMVQGMQVLYHDRLQCFNYGEEENMKKYGKADPPAYNLTQVSAPIFLLSSKDDTVASPAMVSYVQHQIKSISGHYVVETEFLKSFSHGDFTLSTMAPKLVYFKIIEQMNKFE